MLALNGTQVFIRYWKETVLGSRKKLEGWETSSHTITPVIQVMLLWPTHFKEADVMQESVSYLLYHFFLQFSSKLRKSILISAK